MNKTRALVVDDEKSLSEFVRRNLAVRGFEVITAANGLEALALFQSESIDLVIMDIMMPHMDGLETISRIRETSRVPIIALSALGEEEHKVKALNLGADDYLTKPFGVNELLARVRAVVRRASWTPPPGNRNQLVQGEISINLERHQVLVRDEEVDLTPTEFNLLVYFLENPGKVLSHEALLLKVWGPEYGRESEYLRVYIGRLRQKIETDPAQPRYLRTEHGIGYCFVAH